MWSALVSHWIAIIIPKYCQWSVLVIWFQHGLSHHHQCINIYDSINVFSHFDSEKKQFVAQFVRCNQRNCQTLISKKNIFRIKTTGICAISTFSFMHDQILMHCRSIFLSINILTCQFGQIHAIYSTMLTIWKESTLNIVQQIVVAEYQIDSICISWWDACGLTSVCYIPYCVRISTWLFIVMVSYLVV